mmetsp:Transcript_20365/g.52872  ORF Transcript_20365/g.52872 Transcript_20365/m.52872 type:complete len:289 (+) Transcript_20365:20-886(+)
MAETICPRTTDCRFLLTGTRHSLHRGGRVRSAAERTQREAVGREGAERTMPADTGYAAATTDEPMDPTDARYKSIMAEADETTNESLDATRNMRRMAEETRDIGGKTLQELDEQGDKLRKTNQELNEIDNDLKAAEKTLTQMEKCCGCCTCPCYSSKNFERGNSDYKTAFKNKELVTEQPGSQEGDGAGSGGGATSARGAASARGGGKGGNGEYIQRITHDAREDEMNENLGVVHDILGDLKKQANAMGDEIEEQNVMITQINEKTQSNIKRVDAADGRAQRLIRNAY